MTKKDIIAKTLEKLDDRYIHKVMVYALTLLEIQRERERERQKE